MTHARAVFARLAEILNAVLAVACDPVGEETGDELPVVGSATATEVHAVRPAPWSATSVALGLFAAACKTETMVEDAELVVTTLKFTVTPDCCCSRWLAVEL
jgi:hypothetical protein